MRQSVRQRSGLAALSFFSLAYGYPSASFGLRVAWLAWDLPIRWTKQALD
jgi:hypothetical protein